MLRLRLLESHLHGRHLIVVERLLTIITFIFLGSSLLSLRLGLHILLVLFARLAIILLLLGTALVLSAGILLFSLLVVATLGST